MFTVQSTWCHNSYSSKSGGGKRAIGEENNDQVLKLFIVSDSIGETAQRMIHATLTISRFNTGRN